MKTDPKTITIVVAEDDEDDRQWIREALTESRLEKITRFVTDGEQLMDFLFRRGEFLAHTSSLTYPQLIILDLNMPKKDGREALKEIRSDPRLRHIPIIILTTSKAQEDVYRTYSLGANTVIHKPVAYDGYIQIMRSLAHYWLDVAELPL